MEKMVKEVKLPKGFKDERFERVGDTLLIYAVPTQEPYELKNREPMTVIDGIWQCSSKDGRKNEVFIPFWDLTVDDFAGYDPTKDLAEAVKQGKISKDRVSLIKKRILKGKRMLIATISQNTAIGTWVPKYPLSVDEATGEVVSIAGANPATGRNSYQAEDLCKQYDPENASGMKTDAAKYLQIGRTIKDGRLTWIVAFGESNKILDDEGKSINVWDAPDSLQKMLPTGGREIQGISDFYGNVYEILKHTLIDSEEEDDKAEGFSLGGASASSVGGSNPLGGFYRDLSPSYKHSHGAGAAAL